MESRRIFAGTLLLCVVPVEKEFTQRRTFKVMWLACTVCCTVSDFIIVWGGMPGDVNRTNFFNSVEFDSFQRKAVLKVALC